MNCFLCSDCPLSFVTLKDGLLYLGTALPSHVETFKSGHGDGLCSGVPRNFVRRVFN